jgi:hypothetical protein
MGDRGGKKDKEKNQQQHVKKQGQKKQERDEKAGPTARVSDSARLAATPGPSARLRTR